MNKIDEARTILKELGIPKKHTNDMCVLTFLALAGMRESSKWKDATDSYMGIHGIMDFMAENYMEDRYAENTRETVRKVALKPFCNAAITETNGKPTTSPKYAYRLTNEALTLVQNYQSDDWEEELQHFRERHVLLEELYAKKREVSRIPVVINGEPEFLSSNPHNRLQKSILDNYAQIYAQGSQVVYIGDTVDRGLYINHELLAELEFEINGTTILPDIILYKKEEKEIHFVEAVTSVGPISPIRKQELEELAKRSNCNIKYVTAFLKMTAFKKFVTELSWETEVWISEFPEHIVHMD